jgi:hypothetical protein
VQAKTAADSITTYGEKLFAQIFADHDAYSAYKDYLKNGLNNVHIEIAGSPHFHTLHWEALKDPSIRQPLALQATMLRKNLKPATINATVQPSPIINLLIVTARPHGRQDVGYRTISRPLVESLRRANVPVHIDMLRPGTYKLLENHLRTVTTQHSVGYYHVIHFDMHGVLLSYEQLQQVQEANRHLFHDRYARPDLQPFEGVKAFLSLTCPAWTPKPLPSSPTASWTASPWPWKSC